MKKILLLTSIWLIACKAPVQKEMSFAGALPPASKTVWDYTNTYKSGDTTITQRYVTTLTENKSWPDKPPVDTIKPPPVDTTTTTGRVGIIQYSDFNRATAFTSPLQPFILFDTTISGGRYPALKAQTGSAWYWTQNCCSYSIQNSSNARKGNGSAFFTLKKGDPAVSGSARSEIQTTKTLIEPGTKFERWYGWSMNRSKNSDGLEYSIAQWHQSSSGGSPALFLQIKGDKLQVVANQRYSNLVDFPVGTWVDIVVHVKFSTGSDGLVEVFMNGKLVITSSGINNFSGGNYFKLGIYKYTWEGLKADGKQETVYYDEFYAGNEKSDLKSVSP